MDNHYRLPKILFEGDYKQLSNDARLLYAMLLDRHTGDPISISRSEIGTLLGGKSKPYVIKIIKELIALDLVLEKREGMGNVNTLLIAVVA